MLGHLFDHDDKAFVIAAHGDMELLRIFLGERMNRVIPADENSALQIRRACQADPNSYMPSFDSGTALRASPQRGCIRSLHIVDYPYFVELNASRYAQYLDLQRIIMHVPRASKMAMPQFLNSADEACAESVLRKADLWNCKSVIINCVAFSSQQLSLESWINVADLLRCSGYKVAFNVAQASDTEIGKKLNEMTGASILSIPAHLMKTIYDKITLCVGLNGGATGTAEMFGSCSVFSIITKALFSPGIDAYASTHGVLEFENDRAYPRPVKPRLFREFPFISNLASDNLELFSLELKCMLDALESF